MRNSVCVVMPGTVLPLLLILGVVGGAHASSGGAPEPALEETERPEYLFHMTAGSATYEAGLLTLDAEWKFKAPAKIGILIRELREEVRRLLALKLEDPGLQIDSSPIVDALLTLLSSDGL